MAVGAGLGIPRPLLRRYSVHCSVRFLILNAWNHPRKGMFAIRLPRHHCMGERGRSEFQNPENGAPGFVGRRGAHPVTGRKKQGEFVTALDAKTAPAAMLMAMAAIDAGTFSTLRGVTEKFWRFQDRASGSRSDRAVPQISLRPTRSKRTQPGRNERKQPSPKS